MKKFLKKLDILFSISIGTAILIIVNQIVLHYVFKQEFKTSTSIFWGILWTAIVCTVEIIEAIKENKGETNGK